MEILIGIGSGILIFIFSGLIMALIGFILKVALKVVVAIAYLLACLVLGFWASKNGFSISEILVSSLIISAIAFPILLTAAGYFVALEYDETKAKIDSLEEMVSRLSEEINRPSSS